MGIRRSDACPNRAMGKCNKRAEGCPGPVRVFTYTPGSKTLLNEEVTTHCGQETLQVKAGHVLGCVATDKCTDIIVNNGVTGEAALHVPTLYDEPDALPAGVMLLDPAGKRVEVIGSTPRQRQ